jgi:hypothetical protein
LVLQSALQGLGIAQLPLPVCLSEIKRGLLEILLPEFSAPLFEIQLLFPSRHGVLPAVRSFIDFLASRCVSEVADWQIKRHPAPGHRDRGNLHTSRLPHDGQAPLLPNVSRSAA